MLGLAPNAARIAAGYGASVMIAEEYRVGGTCVIRGCVPKKLFVIGSHVRHEIEDAKGFGWTIPEFSFDWTTLVANKDKEIARLEGIYTTNGAILANSIFTMAGAGDTASGTGLAPIKAIVEQLQFKGNTRPVVLYWGCRTKADLYMHDWALQQAADLPWLSYVPVLSEPKLEDAWTGRTGFVHRAVLSDLPDLSEHEVYACGAPVMVDAARREFTAKAGLPDEFFYADAFTSMLDKTGA